MKRIIFLIGFMLIVSSLWGQGDQTVLSLTQRTAMSNNDAFYLSSAAAADYNVRWNTMYNDMYDNYVSRLSEIAIDTNYYFMVNKDTAAYLYKFADFTEYIKGEASDSVQYTIVQLRSDINDTADVLRVEWRSDIADSLGRFWDSTEVKEWVNDTLSSYFDSADVINYVDSVTIDTAIYADTILSSGFAYGDFTVEEKVQVDSLCPNKNTTLKICDLTLDTLRFNDTTKIYGRDSDIREIVFWSGDEQAHLSYKKSNLFGYIPFDSAAATTCAVSNQWYFMQGSFINVYATEFGADADTIQYTGTATRVFDCELDGRFKSSSNTNYIGVAISINDTLYQPSIDTFYVRFDEEIKKVSTGFQVELDPNDKVKILVRSSVAGEDITAIRFNARLTELFRRED